MQRRSLLIAAIGAVVVSGCDPEKRLQVIAPAPAPPPTKIQRVLIWMPGGEAIVNVRSLEKAFETALAPLGVSAGFGRSNPLELNRGDEQKRAMDALAATHRLEIDIVAASYGGYQSSRVLRIVLYAGTARAPLMIFTYESGSSDVDVLAGLVVKKLRERGYL